MPSLPPSLARRLYCLVGLVPTELRRRDTSRGREAVTVAIASEEDDPSKDWFGNQLGFYEIYILPLARRLRKCGAFAPDAGEAFVQNAKNICRRWEYEGAAITDRMIEEVRREYEERTNGGGAAAREASLEKIDEGNRSSMGSSSCASDHSAALKSFDKAEPGK